MGGENIEPSVIRKTDQQQKQPTQSDTRGLDLAHDAQRSFGSKQPDGNDAQRSQRSEDAIAIDKLIN